MFGRGGGCQRDRKALLFTRPLGLEVQLPQVIPELDSGWYCQSAPEPLHYPIRISPAPQMLKQYRKCQWVGLSPADQIPCGFNVKTSLPKVRGDGLLSQPQSFFVRALLRLNSLDLSPVGRVLALHAFDLGHEFRCGHTGPQSPFTSSHTLPRQRGDAQRDRETPPRPP